jgi:hypothetical protein
LLEEPLAPQRLALQPVQDIRINFGRRRVRMQKGKAGIETKRRSRKA